MTETIASPLFGKYLTIGKECNRGGQGRIRETNDPCILVKQFEPAFITDDVARQEGLQHRIERAYPAFCTVNKNAAHVELRSLPREYVRLQGKPGYLMEKAEGQLLQTLLRVNGMAHQERLALGYALARAIALLHAGQMAHGDPHPENYIVRRTPTGWVVSVIDIDGGGLLGPPGPIYPLSQPKRLYKAPELFSATWQDLHHEHLFFAPDDWALAVLLYQLLIDYEGPFCSARAHPNPAMTNYVSYAPFAYRDPQALWPKPWQEALLKRAGLSDQVISLFYTTFQHRFILEEHGKPRPGAYQWERALELAITPPDPPKVRALCLNRPRPVKTTAPKERGQTRPAKPRTMALPLRTRVTRALRAGLRSAKGAFSWRRAAAGAGKAGV